MSGDAAVGLATPVTPAWRRGLASWKRLGLVVGLMCNNTRVYCSAAACHTSPLRGHSTLDQYKNSYTGSQHVPPKSIMECRDTTKAVPQNGGQAEGGWAAGFYRVAHALPDHAGWARDGRHQGQRRRRKV
jgi:hypothetical protein